MTAAGADARGLRAGGGPGEALAALTGDCVAVEGGEVMVEVDVDVDGEDEDEEEDSGWSETAPTPCSSCCTLLSAILLWHSFASSRASPSGSDVRPSRRVRGIALVDVSSQPAQIGRGQSLVDYLS